MTVPQFRSLAATAALLLSSTTLSNAAQYTQNFDGFADGTTDLGDGSVIAGAAASVQGGRLQLTIDDQGLGFSSFSVPALADSSLGWTASFEVELFDAAGANPPADGFSFNYGNAVLGELGSAEEGMNPAQASENLSFEVDTWMNFDAEQGLNISGNSGGVDLGQLAFTNGPILADGTTVSGTVVVSYDPATGASFTTSGLDTNANFVDVATGTFTGNDAYTFVISARVGGANEDLFIDNLIIQTGVSGDSDGDGLADTYEIANGLDPNDDGTIGESSPGAKDGPNGALGDPDMDNLTNAEERDRDTNPQDDDTDGDGLTDDVEDGGGAYVSSSQTGTDPTNPDSDGDTLLDGVEDPNLPFVDANQPGTDPNQADTDGDSVNDGAEIGLGRDPTVFNAPTEGYFQNFDGFADGTTDLGDGSVIAGAAASVQGGRLQLTIDDQGLGFSSFSVPALADSSLGWTASFDVELFDAAGANPPADGFSFNYGNAVLGELGSAEEGMNPAQASENLSFEVDTWMNFDAEQGLNISGNAGGVDQGQLAFTNGSILDDGATVSGTVVVSYDPGTGASFTTTGLNTNANFVDVATGAFTGNDAYTFVISARVGGANEDLFIDNLIIETGVGGDSDGDGLADTYEIANGLDPNDDGTTGESSPGAKDGPNGALGDPDMDNLTNAEERDRGTDPQDDDTDGDGLTDDVEDGGGVYVSASQTGTDPLNPDTDGDTLLDGVEDPNLPFVDANQPGTDPNKADTDGDAVSDGAEIAQGRNPTVFNAPPQGYFQTFDGFANGTTDLADGSVIAGAAASVQNGQLQLTIDGQGLGFSSFSVPPIAGSSNGWTASFDITISDGAGANEPADGLSFNYGNAAMGELGSAEEGMAGVATVTENISFEIDTWMNLDTEQGVNIAEKVGGVDTNLAFTNGSILSDGTSVSGTVSISWNPEEGASFTTTGLLTNADFSKIATTFLPDENHTFIISARVGGANQTLLIDNLIISTGPAARARFEVAGAGSDLLFTWDSKAGKVYDILSSTDPEAESDPAAWAVWQADIPATAPENVETFARPGDPKRFFVLREKVAPPFFSEDFESGGIGWIAGVNDPNNNTSWELGTPAASSGPTSGADGSANAFTTNLGDYGINSDITLRSPVLDLTGVTGATLNFDSFTDADGVADSWSVRVLKASDFAQLGPDLFNSTSFDLDWIGLSAPLPVQAFGEMVVLEFQFISDGSVDPFSGWSIDNVEVKLE